MPALEKMPNWASMKAWGLTLQILGVVLFVSSSLALFFLVRDTARLYLPVNLFWLLVRLLFMLQGVALFVRGRQMWAMSLGK
jgi:hypothetical protein